MDSVETGYKSRVRLIRPVASSAICKSASFVVASLQAQSYDKFPELPKTNR